MLFIEKFKGVNLKSQSILKFNHTEGTLRMDSQDNID